MESKLVEPSHHRAYRDTWEEYSNPLTPREKFPKLEEKLELARNQFGWTEFIEFKKTLDNFEDFWNFMIHSPEIRRNGWISAT
ncbi:MAG: hypothetical protein ACW99G_18275 [Candidatus Thorarchaeota archaeon]|jgi:hypothetical protein